MTGAIHGAIGVLAYDESTERVQCHACGKWFGRLTSHHLARHGLTAVIYKERFGLPHTTALEAPRIAAQRRHMRQRAALRHKLPISPDIYYGERGVLAYDEVEDRIQCHACGRWYHKLTTRHLARHGLTIPEYKELYGLNVGTALETPRITTLRRRQAEESRAHERLVPYLREKGAASLTEGQGFPRRAQYLRTYQTPQRLQEMGRRRRRWSEEEMLSALRKLQAEAGGVLTRYYLERHGPSVPGRFPSPSAVVRRFGSWRRVCELLGQPYSSTRLPTPPGAQRRWSDDEILARLRALQAECGGMVFPSDLERHRSGSPGKVGAYPSPTVVLRRFGSWPRVCELLGQPYHPRRPHPRSRGARRPWSDDEMLSALRELQAEAGGILTPSDLNRRRADSPGDRYPSSQAAVKRFGTWRRVCELLDQPALRRKGREGTERPWTDEAILSALRRLEAELGRPLTARQLYQLRTGGKGKVGAFPSYKTVHDRFGSWQRVRALL